MKGKGMIERTKTTSRLNRGVHDDTSSFCEYAAI
jgi:hypothetical protein